MSVIAGVDIGNATTEIAVLQDGRLLAAERMATRGRKGSAESLRGAAALVHRTERRLGLTITEARIAAPLRAVSTGTVTIPALVPATGRLRVLAAGVATPGGTGSCVGAPLWLDQNPQRPGRATGTAPAWVAVVPPGLGYAAAAGQLRQLLAAGVPVGAVLAAGDEGVLIANRLGAALPVLDQVDTAAVAACSLLAVEVRPPGQSLTLLADPVALGAALRLSDTEATDAATLGRALLDCSNGVVGLGPAAFAPPLAAGSLAAGAAAAGSLAAGAAAAGSLAAGTAAAGSLAAGLPAAGPPADGPWVIAAGQRLSLHVASSELAGQPVGWVSALGVPGSPAPRSRDGQAFSWPELVPVDDLFAVDLAAVADTATARRGSTGRAVLVASLHQAGSGLDHVATLAELLGRPVHCPVSEPAAARLGACTTPGARPDAVVVDVGAGTIDVIAPDGDVVAAGAGELLTAAVAETLGVPRAAADWVKRGPCLRVEDSQRFAAEDGSRGFLDRPADPAAVGMLAAPGPAGLLPFDRRHSPAEWRAIRLRLKEAVFAVNLLRAVRTLGRDLSQVLIVGGPAGDDELLGVLLRALPGSVTAGRGNVGGTLPGPSAGHRHAAALGLALATPPTASPH